ncbi:MAG: hypothetical protein AAF316_17010 [Cyanobacteria bacterium P01_A01_bin.80]
MKVNKTISTSPASPFSTSFDSTLKCYRISAKELSKLTKVSENHISEFRRGKGDVSTNILLRLLDGMEKLSPGSKQHFCQMISGESPQPLGNSLLQIIQVADEDELLDAMGAIATRFRHLRNFSGSISQSLLKVQ